MRNESLSKIIEKEDSYINSYIDELKKKLVANKLNKDSSIRDYREYYLNLCNAEYSFKQLIYYVIGIRQNLFFFIFRLNNFQNKEEDTASKIDKIFLMHENNILKHLKNIKKDKKTTINNINSYLKNNNKRAKKNEK